MADELTLCAAAFFRNKGKTVSTSGEFLMSISMDYHWFPLETAKVILATMVERNILEKKGDMIKPTFDVSTIQVPVAYKPSPELASQCKPAVKNEEVQQQKDMLPVLIEKAMASGMQKKDFIAGANHLSKTLNVDMIVAGLLVLRENGIDVSGLIDPVYSEIKSK